MLVNKELCCCNIQYVPFLILLCETDICTFDGLQGLNAIGFEKNTLLIFILAV